MPDAMDHVQNVVQLNTDDAIAAVTRVRVGRVDCEECGEAISELRRGLGARLCIAHQQEYERRGCR